ncbi:divergent polysaccharide deacetylase family protein [Rubellimicrobium sp. CFH 75288]|uniref:divergent polysaccharide deacetylase family protein n=1 Tax=Rubellimicrobium sp. CFH 75288 TaxID=2697034 RepID=UPI0014122E1F|nr:divergent polysaccharide deacetylase family protein [Rubellimicrobium sp. CFH 75288]NAZ36387.1 hypothetical protein [Rubellimicrobium sp. CFH 75288]
MPPDGADSAAREAPAGRIVVGGQTMPAGGAVPVRRPPAREPSSTEAGEAAALETDPSALRRHAADWTPPAVERPLLSVLLLDDPSLDGAELAVAALPWPVSVAIDPAAPGATERMAAYRAAGVEVLALAELPARAQPSDAAVAYEAMLATLPEAVAVLDLGGGGLAQSGGAGSVALDRLAERGLGLVLAPAGLGGAERAAEAAGVPATTILRDLDANGQDDRVIRRFLDDSARRAGLDGSAVVLARVRAETLTALSLWAGARRAAEVSVAPVSAVLRED